MKPLENLKEYFQKYEETHVRDSKPTKLPFPVMVDLKIALDNIDFWLDGMQIVLDVDSIYSDMSLYIDLEDFSDWKEDFYVIDHEESKIEGSPVYELREDWREEMANNLRLYVNKYISKTKIELA